LVKRELTSATILSTSGMGCKIESVLIISMNSTGIMGLEEIKLFMNEKLGKNWKKLEKTEII
jgi:hypothetical protein